jgi:TetR/AcrR family transcriptional regulator
MTKRKNVEQDIINAARIVFQKNGFRDATMRDIANEADINMAMLHYYFRSKDNLFSIIFMEAFRSQYEKIEKIVLNDKLDIFEKIRIIIDEYVTFFDVNPKIPQFIVREAIRNPERIGEMMKRNINPLVTFKLFSKQLEECSEKGIIREISAFALLLNIISLCVFPIIAKPVIGEIIGENIFNVELRKKGIAEFVINSIKL